MNNMHNTHALKHTHRPNMVTHLHNSPYIQSHIHRANVCHDLEVTSSHLGSGSFDFTRALFNVGGYIGA